MSSVSKSNSMTHMTGCSMTGSGCSMNVGNLNVQEAKEVSTDTEVVAEAAVVSEVKTGSKEEVVEGIEGVDGVADADVSDVAKEAFKEVAADGVAAKVVREVDLTLSAENECTEVIGTMQETCARVAIQGAIASATLCEVFTSMASDLPYEVRALVEDIINRPLPSELKTVCYPAISRATYNLARNIPLIKSILTKANTPVSVAALDVVTPVTPESGSQPHDDDDSQPGADESRDPRNVKKRKRADFNAVGHCSKRQRRRR